MFVDRTHTAFIDLAPGDDRLYRLPPMSNGPFVRVAAFDAFVTNGPQGPISHTGGASDLELELRHSNHLSLPGTNLIITESQWHDDLWRLRVRRTQNPLSLSMETRQYKVEASYTSQLPVLERRVSAGFFHDGFNANYNDQQYIRVRLFSSTIEISFREDFRALYNLETTYTINTAPLMFDEEVAMTSMRLEVGAGPGPMGGGNALFFSIRAEFPSTSVSVNVPVAPDPKRVLPPFYIEARLYLDSVGNLLQYLPKVESNLLDQLNFEVRIPHLDGSLRTVNVRQFVKQKVEDGIYNLQGTPSKFGAFLAPWLVGGRKELFGLGYAPGPGDVLRPDGIIEPATGDLLVRYVGPRAKPVSGSVLVEPGHPPVDDGAIRLFNLPDEEPDPVANGGGGTFGDGTGLGGHGGGVPHPDIGALAKINHIVVLMQENRSFDQVLGYLSRDLGRSDVEGLNALPADPHVNSQFNRLNNRNFFPQKADKSDPQRDRATAWPSFSTPGPCHEHECVVRQMDSMGGFVSDFAKRLGSNDPADLFTASHLRLVMDYFSADDLPVYAILAREFGICDHWYCSHVGSTWPNRYVLLTGDLNRDPDGNLELDQPPTRLVTPLERPTLFDYLTEHKVEWRVFEHGFGFQRLFGNFTFDTTNIVPFNDPVRGFEASARGGSLPSVTLIEPDYIDLPPGNDDHPPTDMAWGQVLVGRIVQALLDSPPGTWEHTLLVITYDEHGGFYDHVQPPADAPPIGGSLTVLGPRVPTFVISPLVERGKPFHSRFDHTSIGATILRRFLGGAVPKISPRIDNARDLREVLTLSESRPRSDFADLGLVAAAAASGVVPSTVEARKPIGNSDGTADFHWVLAATRLTTGQPPKVGRPVRMISGELLFYRDKTWNGTGVVASPSVIGLGGWQTLQSVFSGGNGIIYAADQDGRLLFYRDANQDGTGDVSTPSVIGLGGWQSFKFLFSGGNGIIYAVDQEGRLLFYKDRTQNGTGDVSSPSVIGLGGWQSFKFVFSGGDGIIYAVDQDGKLFFYRDNARDGTINISGPSVIGLGGWQGFRLLFSGGNGTIYAVDQQGRLLFYKDNAQNGTGNVSSSTVIGLGGWQIFKFIFSGGNGILYAVVA